MSFLNQEKIEKMYKQKDILWGTEPNKYVLKLPEIIKNGKILDLGVGEGRNAIFLSKEGFEVLGVDISERAINKFTQLAKENNLNAKGIVEDISNYNLTDLYPGIICIGTIHFLNSKIVDKLIKKMKDHTLKGGINLIVAFTKEDEGNKTYPELHFIEKGELEAHYSNWEIIENKYYEVMDHHGIPHKHSMMVIMAKK